MINRFIFICILVMQTSCALKVVSGSFEKTPPMNGGGEIPLSIIVKHTTPNNAVNIFQSEEKTESLTEKEVKESFRRATKIRFDEDREDIPKLKVEVTSGELRSGREAFGCFLSGITFTIYPCVITYYFKTEVTLFLRGQVKKKYEMEVPIEKVYTIRTIFTGEAMAEYEADNRIKSIRFETYEELARKIESDFVNIGGP